MLVGISVSIRNLLPHPGHLLLIYIVYDLSRLVVLLPLIKISGTYDRIGNTNNNLTQILERRSDLPQRSTLWVLQGPHYYDQVHPPSDLTLLSLRSFY